VRARGVGEGGARLFGSLQAGQFFAGGTGSCRIGRRVS
jgi:hypothetical protein